MPTTQKPSRTGAGKKTPIPQDLKRLRKLLEPTIASYDSFFSSEEGSGFRECLKSIGRFTVSDGGVEYQYWLEGPEFSKPKDERGKPLLPSNCRLSKSSYTAPVSAVFCSCKKPKKSRKKSDSEGEVFRRRVVLGQLPVMVGSKLCHLHNATPVQMIQAHEDEYDPGGYFITNGSERCFRNLVLPRANHPLVMERKSYAGQSDQTPYACIVRSRRADHTSCMNFLHLAKDGGGIFRVAVSDTRISSTLLIPVILILKACVETTDLEIYKDVLQGSFNDSFISTQAHGLLKPGRRYGLSSRVSHLRFLGEKFGQYVLTKGSLSEVGKSFLDTYILVHVDSGLAKYRLLVLMMNMLYRTASGQCSPQNLDTAQYQEPLMAGGIMAAVFRANMTSILGKLGSALETGSYKSESLAPQDVLLTKDPLPQSFARSLRFPFVQLTTLLGCGTATLSTLSLLPQRTGLTIWAEKVNFFRFLSYFRAIHSGQRIAASRDTSFRKLRPETWGFVCPVHTPDGTPCGILNHFSHTCEIVPTPTAVEPVMKVLRRHGVSQDHLLEKGIPIVVAGQWVASATPRKAVELEKALRKLKCTAPGMKFLEIGLILPSNGGEYPALTIATHPRRMMRPVTNILLNCTEYIGACEQVYLNIAVKREEVEDGVTTHLEISPCNMLSVMANLTPFSDHNQSPRNMYQCQMAKQSTGWTTYTGRYRSDVKMFSLENPQQPLVSNRVYNHYGLQHYPKGVNAMVAVVAYTGYDMEDAMIVNKASANRGMLYAQVVKTVFIDATEIAKKYGLGNKCSFRRYNIKKEQYPILDHDGLPLVGVRLKTGDVIACVVNDSTKEETLKTYQGVDSAFVESVTRIGKSKAIIKLREPRPIGIGEKSSSRHGQKGICSLLLPQADMPFTESGIVPDIIINPHAFPSRMTIGMLVESNAAKAGATHGIFQDGTPFQFDKSKASVDYFGEQLVAAGYNYYGQEVMYSGITGEEMQCDIFFGPVYYQRLRHMIADKFQVRATGPIDTRTRQPVQGRRRKGGIRFGEMERDAVIAHGGSAILQDRLMSCSDESIACICKGCGSLLSTLMDAKTRTAHCQGCGTGEKVVQARVPTVFRLLASELASVGLKLDLQMSDHP